MTIAASPALLGRLPSNGAHFESVTFSRSDEVTFTGLISGSGALTQFGAGTLTLTADNTYSNATVIAAGTLQLGNGGTTGNIGSSVLNDLGTLAFNRSNLLTFGTSIFGAGAVKQIGTGMTVLTANNTYTGGTTINAGTIQLGPGGSLAPTGALTVNLGGTFDLNSHTQTVGDLSGTGSVLLGSGMLTAGTANATTFSGVMSGTGSFTKQNAGTLTFAGINNYTGATTINGGTLAVNGSITSPVTVNSGGTLGGTGTVFGNTTVNNGGTLSPGNSIGVFNVAGNLVFGPGSVYRVEVSPTAADRTNVTGTATLNGAVNAVFGPGAYASNSYTILSATGGRTGTFSALTAEGLPVFLSASLSYNATDALLVTLLSKIGDVSGLTFNERAVARAQDSTFNAGLPGLGALYNLTLAQLPAALDALSGEVHASTAGVLVDESLYVRSAVLGRLRQASYGGDTTMAALATGGPQAAFADGTFESALAYGKLPVKAPFVAPEPSRDVAFWAQGFGAWGKFNGDGNAASLDRNLAGFISGVDARFSDNWRAGIAAGYTGARVGLAGRGSADVDTAHLAAYTGVSAGALNLRFGGAYASHSIATDRMVLFPGFADRLTARYDGGTGQAFGEIGYGVALGNVAVEPFAGAAWVHLRTDAFSEHGGLAALAVAANTFEVGFSTLGVRAASMIPMGYDMILVPRASAAWQHAYSDVTPTATLAFQSAGAPFMIAGVPIARDSLLAEAGLDLNIGRNTTLGVSYVGQIASNVQDHAAKGKFTWKF